MPWAAAAMRAAAPGATRVSRPTLGMAIPSVFMAPMTLEAVCMEMCQRAIISPLGGQPVAVAEFAGGDLGAQLPDDLHVQRDRPVQLGGPVTHLPSMRRTASLFSILELRRLDAGSGSPSLESVICITVINGV